MEHESRPSSALEHLERQIEEIDAVQATFFEPNAFLLAPPEQDAGQCDSGLPQLSGTVVLLDTLVAGQPVALHFSLPVAYPAAQAQLRVDSCAGVEFVWKEELC